MAPAERAGTALIGEDQGAGGDQEAHSNLNANIPVYSKIAFAKEGALLNITRIFYWTATTLITLETLVGGVADVTHGRTVLVSGPFVTDVVAGLGYPAYVLWIIGIWKILGAITLVVPGFLRLKEWAYAGIVFELSGAVASLAVCGHTAELIAPLFLLSLALASWALRPPSRTLGKPLVVEQ